ncbi:5-methyltetrahydrofolate--homocysteine methyltransferase [Algibacillus agarilyticus]|uniref:5-methyltetrahydrofolate--homocysteine methyltransferase n=1 Tax=Algibacillus agarilyticus TaxID=2234133 RepID=UPI000DD04F00|nr:5-methyltetrahydrofolate--homocysteine methyltransferase [Algibacillus agarilyticus]
MTNSFKFNLVAMAMSTLLLASCGDAKTTIIEKDSIVDHDDHNHDDEFTIESKGRLAALMADNTNAAIFDLDDGDLLDQFSLTYSSNSLNVSADYRYAIIASRSNDHVSFIDSGLWREDHTAHLHDYKQAPQMSDFSLTGSRPTHIIKHDGKLAVFFDGNADAGTSASVQVVSDLDITNENNAIASLDYTMNMHGAAEPRGEYLLSTVRRDDADSTSNAKILPDQVGGYHLHDGEYELDKLLTLTCPDLHGAAQNHEYVLFGCGDGVLVAKQENTAFTAAKIANIDDLEGLRIGTLYSHEDLSSFIGVASAHGGSHAIVVNINPEANTIEKLEWQPAADASAISYAFSAAGEHFLVLDEQGYLNVLTQHQGNTETHWELATRLDISDEDVSQMPEGMSFSMTVAQNGDTVYVSDPIAQHVLQVDLETLKVVNDIELGFAAKSITWLGIAEAEHDH